MSDAVPDLSNPYESPALAVEEEVFTGPVQLPISREVWLATALIWTGCLVLASAAFYVLLAWFEHTFPRVRLGIDRADQLAQFATGASNAIVMAGIFAYGQYHAVIRRDPIWTRTVAMLLIIGALVIAMGAVVIFPGDVAMWLLILPAAVAALLSALMFRWHGRLTVFRRQTRKATGVFAVRASATER